MLLMKSNVTLLVMINMVLLAELRSLWSENDMVSLSHVLSVAGCLHPQRQQYQHLKAGVIVVAIVSGCWIEECVGNDHDRRCIGIVDVDKGLMRETNKE